MFTRTDAVDGIALLCHPDLQATFELVRSDPIIRDCIFSTGTAAAATLPVWSYPIPPTPTHPLPTPPATRAFSPRLQDVRTVSDSRGLQRNFDR